MLKPPKVIIESGKVYRLSVNYPIAVNTWLAIFRSMYGSYALVKCTEKIISTGSPYKDEGFAVVYYNETYETITDYAESELEHMKLKLALLN